MTKHPSHYKHLIGSVALIISLTSCASIPLDPGAENVRITYQLPANCRVMGPVKVIDISGITVMYTSKQNLRKMQLNSLRNQALKLGANTVLITGRKTTGGSPEYIVSTGEFVNNSNDYSEVTFGTAYSCK